MPRYPAAPRALASALACAALTATAAAPANADVTVTSFQGISVVSNDEPDSVSIRRVVGQGSMFEASRFANFDNTITAGGGCEQVNEAVVRCTTGLARVSANMAGGGDSLRVQGHPSQPFDVTANGGDGNDTLAIPYTVFTNPSADRYSGAVGAVTFDGGAGNDTIDAGGSPDRISDDPRDVFRGGAGTDTVVYKPRTEQAVDSSASGVNISLDGVANDGEPGEFDNVATDVEAVVGTRRPDILTGTNDSARRDYLRGEDSPDQIRGLAGDDVLIGGRLADVLDGGSGDDLLYGDNRVFADPLAPGFTFGPATSSNELETGDKDRLTGGPGADGLDGGSAIDVYSGGTGRDFLITRDGIPEDIDCGEDAGRGTAVVFDVADMLRSDLPDPSPASCETVDKGEKREGSNVDLALGSRAAARAGRVHVRIRCVRRSRVRCVGRVQALVVNAGGRRLAGAARAGRFAIRRGRSAVRTLRLGPAARRALARRSGGYLRLRSVIRGQFGDLTATETVRVR